MNDVRSGMTCHNCGAPITSEICPYCGTSTGIDTATANMDYPVLECKEVNLNFWTVLFPAIFAFMFTIGGILPIAESMALISFSEDDFISSGERSLIMLFCLPFLFIGLASWYFTLRPVVRLILVKKNGKRITATVYGYTDDIMRMNGNPAQVMKLLIDTPVGKRFIMYQLGNTERPYGVNTTVDLIVYKNYFMIEKKREVIHW